MQVVIMAAGKGSRIKELSDGNPKGFLEINGQPLIDLIVNNFNNYKRGVEIILVAGYKKECYENHLARKNIQIIHNPFYDAGQVLSSFWFTLPLLNNDQELIFCHADTIYEESILNELMDTPGDIVLAVSKTNVDEEAMKFVLDKDEKNIIRVNKKISLPQADGEFIGLCKIAPDVINSLKQATVELVSNIDNRKSCYFEDALELLLSQKKYTLTPCFTKEMKWVEIDDASDYAHAIKLFEK